MLALLGCAGSGLGWLHGGTPESVRGNRWAPALTSKGLAAGDSAKKPSGWGGYGADDPVTYEPILPADRSFASVLAGTDELVFSTYVSGWLYGYSVFDVAVNNISISAVPEPSSWALMALGLVASVSLVRRRRPATAV